MTIPDSTDALLRGYPYRHGVLFAHLRSLVTAFERYLDASRGTSANNDIMVALGAIAFAQNGIEADETISAEILERLTGPDDEPQAEKVREYPNTTRGETRPVMEYPTAQQSETDLRLALVQLDEHSPVSLLTRDQAETLVWQLYKVHGVTIIPRGMG